MFQSFSIIIITIIIIIVVVTISVIINIVFFCLSASSRDSDGRRFKRISLP